MPATTDTTKLFRTEADLALDEARKRKAEKLKDLGQPIRLPSKPIAMHVSGDAVWTAESGHVLRKSSLETGATLQLYKGHEGPVSALAFADRYVLTGSWDKTIRVWDPSTKTLLSTTVAHRDFVKTLVVIPSQRVLASGSSDKTIRFWDISDPNWARAPLKPLGACSAHTRPVVCLSVDENSFTCTRLFSADSAGFIKVWLIERQYGAHAKCKAVLETELGGHRTGINEMRHGGGLLWTASTDATARLTAYPVPRNPLKPIPELQHDVAVKCILPLPATQLSQPYVLTGSGDCIRLYDISTLHEPEVIAEFDAHANDVTALGYWLRANQIWIVSASLDGTIRKWNLADIINQRRQYKAKQRLPTPPPAPAVPSITLTAEEEAELADLMDSEDSESESSREGSPEPGHGSRQPSPPPTSSASGSSARDSSESLPKTANAA